MSPLVVLGLVLLIPGVILVSTQRGRLQDLGFLGTVIGLIVVAVGAGLS